MDITIQAMNAGITLIGLDGGLDSETLKELRSQVNRLLDEGHHQIIIDCSSLKFVSSAGIGALVMLHRSVKALEGTIHFAGANGAVLDVLELMNLGTILNLSPDIEHARLTLARTQNDTSS